MYGKNSLNDINTNSISENIIKIFKNLKNKDIQYLQISYFLLKTDYEEDDIYDAIYELLESGRIEKYEFEKCPICLKEEIIQNNKHKSICSYCRDVFNSDFIIEKFKLVDGI